MCCIEPNVKVNLKTKIFAILCWLAEFTVWNFNFEFTGEKKIHKLRVNDNENEFYWNYCGSV